MSRPRKPDIHLGTEIAKEDIHYGICYFLIDPNHPLYHAHFDWVGRFTYPHDNEVRERIEIEMTGVMGGLDIVARADSWYGYYLVVTGRYEEAIPFLNEVVPFFKSDVQRGGEIMYWIEFHLHTALLPLCEYKLDPTKENRAPAQKGLDDFIRKVNDFDDKMDSFLYYSHLKGLFPEVYATPAKGKKPKKVNKKNNPVFQHPLPVVNAPPEDETHGGVVLETAADHLFEFIARKSAFEHLCEKNQELGKYPVLGNGYDLFISHEFLEPGPIIRECNELMKENSLTEEEKESISEILLIATHAEELHSEVQFLYNEYW